MSVDRNQASPASPRVLVSHAHADGIDNAILLATELRLRGFYVVRDLEEFRAGHQVGDEMDDAISGEAVLAHLGPHALASNPVVEKELNPALRAFRRTGRPTVMLLAHGIGGDRLAADATVAGRLDASFQAAWAKTFEASPDPLTTETAQRAANEMLQSIYGPGRGPAGGQWNLLLASRDSRPQFEGLVVDATDGLGGDRQVGTDGAWNRTARGIRDLGRGLQAHSARRHIQITPRAHLSAAFYAGLTFSRAGHWQLSVVTPTGNAVAAVQHRTIAGNITVSKSGGPPDDHRLFIGVDLAGRDVSGSITRLTAREGKRPGRALYFERDANAEFMTPDEIAETSSAIAYAIRRASDDFQPKQVDLFLAVPAAAAVLLGHELDTLDMPIRLYEHEAGQYRLVLEHPCPPEQPAHRKDPHGPHPGVCRPSEQR